MTWQGVFRSLTFQALICCSVHVPSFLELWVQFQFKLFLLECEKVLSSHVVYIGFDWWVRVVFALPGYPWGGFFSTSELETVGQPWRWNFTILLYRESLFHSWKLWESPEDEFIQYFFIGKAYVFQSQKLCESPEDATIQHFLIGFLANFGEDEGGDTVVQ